LFIFISLRYKSKCISDIRVQVKNGEVDLYGEAQTGFQRALAQKFLENMDGVKIIRNKISVI